MELHPDKTVPGTETYPTDIVRMWGIAKKYLHADWKRTVSDSVINI